MGVSLEGFKIKKLGTHSFYSTKITSIDLTRFDGDTLEQWLFSNANKLKKVYLKKEIVNINDGCFYACNNLETIDFNNNTSGIKKIGHSTFSSCEKLNGASFNKLIINTPDIGDNAFINCSSLIDINISSFDGNKVKVIKRLFENCKSLETITLPPGIDELPYRFFFGCNNLKNIINKDSIKKIGTSVFSGTNICDEEHSFKLPNLETYDKYAFENCIHVKKFIFEKLTLKKDIEGLFRGCSKLEEITISNINVDKIIAVETFKNCKKLKRILYKPPGESYLIDGLDYSSSPVTNNLFNIIKEFGKESFSGCFEIFHERSINYTFSNCTKIGEKAFYNYDLIEKKLLKISLPKIQELYDEAFNSDNGIQARNWSYSGYWSSVYFEPDIELTLIGSSDKSPLKLSEKTNFNTLKYLDLRYFRYLRFHSDCFNSLNKTTDLIEVKLPTREFVHGTTLTTYPNEKMLSFRRCANLEIVDIPYMLTNMPDYCFEGCTKLKGHRRDLYSDRIYLLTYKNIPIIGKGVYQNCASLGLGVPVGNGDHGSIDLGDKVKIIDEFAFHNCNNISNIICSDDLVEIRYGAFSNCDKLESINMRPCKDTLSFIDKGAFYGCHNFIFDRDKFYTMDYTNNLLWRISTGVANQWDEPPHSRDEDRKYWVWNVPPDHAAWRFNNYYTL